jgi:predicted nucleic acid-binding Zn ribbon protein
LANEAERTPSGMQRRGRREELLLELGALVYELHRRGRRAPELLRKKAGELDALETDAHEGVLGRPCPACGEPATRGQLVCLNCGEPLARETAPKRAPALLVVLGVVIVVAAAALGFALNELTGGGDDEEKGQVAQRQRPGSPETQALLPAGEEPTTADGSQGAAQRATRSLLLRWPPDLTGHTVVLLNTSDRAAARRLARDAARSGIEAGLLRSEDYNLGAGLWIVFAGRFDTRRGAERQSENLASRYPGAYVELIKPVS